MDKLTDADRISPTWQKLKKSFEQELQTLRMKNDNETPEEVTAKIRGRIAMLKEILRLGEEPRQ